ncbi:MAG: hypothetical protein ACW991_10855 [Candidatus Hodarchaeales archaeon]
MPTELSTSEQTAIALNDRLRAIIIRIYSKFIFGFQSFWLLSHSVLHPP